MLALINVLAEAFTDDPQVLDRLHAIWPLFALMQPLNGIVFALDGILIGAGDTRFLKWSTLFAAVGVYIPIALLSLHFGWGIVGVWCGLVGSILGRLSYVRVAVRREAVGCGGRSRECLGTRHPTENLPIPVIAQLFAPPHPARATSARSPRCSG